MDFEIIKSLAKQVLIKDGYHCQMVMLFSQHDAPMVIQLNWETNEDKRDLFVRVNQLIEERQVEYYTYIMEAVGRECRTQQEMDYIQNNLDTESPSLYPESMVKKLLVVEERHRNGTGKICFIGFKTENEKVEIIEEVEEKLPSSVLFNEVNFFKIK